MTNAGRRPHCHWLLALALSSATLSQAAARGDAATEGGSAPPVQVRKPPMGFNTWNHFHMLPTEQIFLETAANFTATGLREAGWVAGRAGG